MESRWDDNRPSDPVIPEDPAVLSDAKRVYRETEIDPFLDEGVVPIEAQCPYFGVCGGCHLQHLPYDAQLQVKTRRVSHAFKAAGVELPLPDRIRGMDDPWSYRNKVDFSTRIFGGVMRLGFSHFGSGRVVETEACAIASHSINEALGGFRRAFPEHPRLKRKIHSLILRSGNGDTEAVALPYAVERSRRA